mgnify:CR=1 FL=1
MDDKKQPQENQNPQDPQKPETPAEPSSHTWVDDMKQELEDYIEEQGIYIRQ